MPSAVPYTDQLSWQPEPRSQQLANGSIIARNIDKLSRRKERKRGKEGRKEGGLGRMANTLFVPD